MATDSRKFFKVVTTRGAEFRLTHIPSGDYVQVQLCDFLSREAALRCRDRMIAAAPDWDWSDAGFFAEMPTALYAKVTAEIHMPRRAT